MVFNIIICSCSFPARTEDWSYFIVIVLSHLINSCVLTLFPVPVAKTFGMKYGMQVYSLVLVSWGPTAVTNIVFNWAFYKDNVQYGNIFVYVICIMCSLLAIFVNYYFEE